MLRFEENTTNSRTSYLFYRHKTQKELIGANFWRQVTETPENDGTVVRSSVQCCKTHVQIRLWTMGWKQYTNKKQWSERCEYIPHANTNYLSLIHDIIMRMLNTSKVIFSNHSTSCDGTWELTCHQLVDHTHGLLLAFHHCKPFEPIKDFWSIPHHPPPRHSNFTRLV